MTRYIDEYLRNSVARKKNQEKDYEVNEEDVELKEKFEVTNEAESFSVKIFSPDCSKHFELTLAFIGVGSPYDKTIQWSISVPFELTFVDVLIGREKEYAIGSKIKSDGLINPCVLKIEGEEISRKTSNWNGRFNEGILVEIKPKYVHTIENFIEAYELYCNRRNSWELSDDDSNSFLDSSSTETSFDQDEIDTDRPQTAKKNAYDITASICEITIELKNAFDRDLLQVVIIYPEFSISQNEKTRSIDFKIEDLKGYNCFENIPFFHPTRETEEKPSLAISILEKISTSADKLSFEKFSFGSCDTTVLVGETLLLAVLKDFGLHKKIPKVFLGSGEDRKKSVSRASTKRFHFDHFELRDVEVILTLLPATDLPVDLKIIKNNLGIPHQLPPKIENACLQFDAFIRKDIQYGSYKYISYDIKNHYLKEFGSQSARVLGSMHLLGNISRLKQDIMSGFKTLRETGEFVTFFRQVTTGVASSYSKLAGSWSGLFGFNSSTQNAKESHIGNERRHSDPSDLDVAMIRQLSENDVFVSPTSKDDSEVLNVDDDYLWMNSSILPGINNEPDGMNWDTESSDGEATLGIPLELIPKNVKRQIKGQEFLRRLKENIGDNEHGEVFSCCLKVRKTDAENKLNALLSNRKVYFLKGRPCHESLVLCVKYETLYKAQYIFKDKTHYVQLVSKMKGIKTLSIPSRNPGESPLVRCDDVLAARKISSKINELKRDYDHEYMHIQHQ
ncbi:uncharacterized protein LOC124440376 [Xenia sp. Carnegie-2017]|uniref:uncharacterized protein LOC124440376 n=1 Tax=Xenia sp. Carnegie-2017 TaxID=2897299 RepID=UPI001F0475ED|nr:uncharacterized protein LOC124440376 [Xenia sp. Carnegie-2017]